MKRKNFLKVIISSILFINYLNCEIKIFYIVKLSENKISKINQCIASLKLFENYGYKNIFIIEKTKGFGPTFLDNYSSNVLYTRLNDFSISNKRMRILNEAKILLDGLNNFKVEPNDIILKLNSKSYLNSNKIIKLLENNPEIDGIARILHNGTSVSTTCFAMRYKYLIDMLLNLNQIEIKNPLIFFEDIIMRYLQKIIKKENAKIVFVDSLDITTNFLGASFKL